MTSDTPIEEALAFYANKDNWACWMGSSNYPLSSQAMVDRGHLAREAHAALTASPAAPQVESWLPCPRCQTFNATGRRACTVCGGAGMVFGPQEPAPGHLTASPAAPTDEETGKLVEALTTFADNLGDGINANPAAAVIRSHWPMSGGNKLAWDLFKADLRQAAAHLTTQAEQIARLREELERSTLFGTETHREYVESEARAEAENARLTARLGEVKGWRPIETAPKDGTKFDAWVPDAFGGHRMTDLSFNVRGKLRQDGLLTEAELPRWPTHWRPPPASPTLAAEAKLSALTARDLRIGELERERDDLDRKLGDCECGYADIGDKYRAAEAKLAALTAPAHDLDALREAVARIVEWCVKRAIGRPPMPLEEIIQFGTKQLLALPAIRNALARGCPNAQE